MKQLLKWMMVVVACALLVACGGEKKKEAKQQQTIVTAKISRPVTNLFFNGSLKPITTYSVTSPVDGRVVKVHFNYGEYVTKGQDLFALTSKALAEDFRKAVQNYLQAKDTYENGIEKFAGDKALYEAGVNSRETFLSNQSTYENNVLKYFQAKFQLGKILRQVNINPKVVEKLTLKEPAQVEKLLQRKFSDIIVKATGNGVALFPLPTQSDGGDGGGGDASSGKMHVGSQVKQGQLVLSIGDLTGLKAEIDVSEVNINRINVGMDATITSEAFPGVTLNGKVSQVASQAKPGQSGDDQGLSKFSVQIQVPSITEAEKKVIRVGMTAKIEINIKGKPSVTIPFKAVFIKDGQSMVTVVDAQGNKKNVVVQTGKTSADSIVITQGVKAGDKVVVND